MTTTAHPVHAPAQRPTWLRPHAWSLLYWLAFLLVLEPGNMLRASEAGQTLSLPHEALRILLAALLGTTTTSAVQALMARFPLRGPARGRHLLIHAAGAAALALTLILASCFLAAWAFAGRWLPSGDEIRGQLVGNFTLLMFALAALTALFQASPWRMAMSAPAPVLHAAPASPHVEVKRRGQLVSLPLSEVDWIEAQGNYVALHVGAEQLLVRDTVSGFCARLDAGQFLRIHRSMIVAVDRIRRVEALSNGDALLHLTHGGPLRASRSHAAAVRAVAARLREQPAPVRNL
ncbi:MAG: LytTR family DNA-binding domain-containing protein [Pseudomonadota bacterium]